MTIRAFISSGIISLLLSGLWIFGLSQAVVQGTHGAHTHGWQTLLIILFASYAVLIAASVGAALVLFRERKWQAACGSLSGSCLFICGVMVAVAWHHHLTTGP
jgi:hypothetical protein